MRINRTVLRHRVLARIAIVASLAIAAAVPALLLPDPAVAASCTATWTGAAHGDWGTAANWSPAAVPDSTSIVCVTTSRGPIIATGYAATARQLTLTGSTMSVNGTLSVNQANLTGSNLSGAGAIIGVRVNKQSSNAALSGVRVFGTLSIRGWDSAQLTGRRTMCGGRMSLCLGDASRFSTGDMLLDDAMIGGTSTVHPAVKLQRDLALTGTDRDRIAVDADVPGLLGYAGATATVEMDNWEQLTSDGTFMAQVSIGSQSLVVSRPIVSIITANGAVILGVVRTVSGADALSELTTVAGNLLFVTITQPTTIQPDGGTLDVAANSTVGLAQTAGTITVDGALTNEGNLSVRNDLRADAFTNTGYTDVYGSLTADTVAISGGTLYLETGTVNATNGVSITNTGDLFGVNYTTCAQVNGPLTMSGNSRLHQEMTHQNRTCPAEYSVSGPVQLPATLAITNRSAVRLGARLVVFDAPAGITGTFTTITGQNFGVNHWQIDYTATEIVATLVAGNV